MTNIIAVVTTNQSSAVVKSQSDIKVPSVGIQGPAGPTSEALQLDQLFNVDASSKTNGSVLVYKTNTSKWTSTTTLDAQNMEGGEF
jgi:hypothetical protein